MFCCKKYKKIAPTPPSAVMGVSCIQHNPEEDELLDYMDDNELQNRLKSQILSFYNSIKNYTPEKLNSLSTDELYHSYSAIDNIIHQGIDDRLGETILTVPDLFIAITVIRSFYTRFISICETNLAKKLIIADSPWSVLESFPLYTRYETLVRDHGKSLNLSSNYSLAFIGCGPLPISLILFNQIFRIRLIGLDIDSESVSLARRCIRSFGMEHDISIVHGDESRLLGLHWDSILVAALAEPKYRIFQNLYSILKKRGNLPVSYRTYTGIRAILYRPVQSDDIKGFNIIEQSTPENVNNTIVFLEME